MSPENVSDAISQIASFIARYAGTLAAIGTLSMALIEMFKGLLSWRDRFHKRLILDWVQNVRPPEQVLGGIRISREEFHKKLYAQLIRLTTGESISPSAMTEPIEWTPWDISPSNALFALELEKMMGQIQDAADTVLGNPHVYPELYLFLSSGSDPKDIANWFEWAQQPPARTTEDASLAKRQADTYARLRQFIRRRLDAFQLTAGYRWQTGNQVTSVALGAALLFASLVFSARNTPPQDLLSWIGLVLVSLIGGIMAPVAKDLVVALKRMRSGG
ncbi:MAG: hypothetical protein RI101_08580 [Nitrospira sp.]|jgi:hypothetical protein|nr:hypothetical protein [Nitrospira sp.]